MSKIIYEYFDRELSSWISKKPTLDKFLAMTVPELDTLNINAKSSYPSKLKLYNSLTRSKDEFRPLNGNQVKAYICGPTVYASAHLGHARAYLSFDILRRVLSKYFNYDVLYVMNITDIDDKIIKRARQNFLFDQYAAKATEQPLKQVFNDVIEALGLFDAKFRAETDPDKQKMLTELIQKVNNAVKNIEVELLSSNLADSKEKTVDLIDSARDILAEWLDNEFGHTVTDHSVFSTLSKHFENDFLLDMDALNVRQPDVITRVSEYIPEIVEFTQKIIDNGYGYKTSDGSYAKLVPEAYRDKDSIEKHLREGEGELSFKQDRLSEKRSAADFALWKSSKAGEPEFESKWGKGRPGWHVECSVMSTEICGDKLDIHAGGFDLKFPHHDNEIAQCEAHFDNDNWVQYFLHCGTLRIEGSKMSKSLKNFISIKDALKRIHSSTIATSFPDAQLLYRKYESDDCRLLDLFSTIKSDIHVALCDSIDTRTVIEKLRELINAANIYIKEKNASEQAINTQLLKTIAEHVTHLLKMFGAIPDQEQIGYPSDQQNGTEVDRESVLMPHLTALAEFRQNVRSMAREQKNTNILQECDRLRDDVLPSLGVRLEDSGAHTAVKLVDPEILLREQEQKRAIEDAKRLEKERKKREQEEKERLKRIPPHEFFKQPSYAAQYAKYDENGIPTHNSQGKDLQVDFQLLEMSTFKQNCAGETDTCCRHGRGCDLATSEPTPQEKSDRSLIRNASDVYLKTGDVCTLDDERTFFENRPQPKDTYRVSSSNKRAKQQQTKNDTLIDRFYLGCRTKSGAARVLSDRHFLGLYHEIPVSDEQLRRGLQQQQKDISIDVEFALHIIQREENGDVNHYRVYEKDNGYYGRVFYVDFNDELKGVETHLSLEELLHFHVNRALVKRR
ncbi:Cysteinyl-tRNA synthetase [Aphelenchoides besseyi]|nr:Cysteinyl-tRNA synthetase [Aphelenchoides besseyi]